MLSLLFARTGTGSLELFSFELSAVAAVVLPVAFMILLSGFWLCEKGSGSKIIGGICVGIGLIILIPAAFIVLAMGILVYMSIIFVVGVPSLIVFYLTVFLLPQGFYGRLLDRLDKLKGEKGKNLKWVMRVLAFVSSGLFLYGIVIHKHVEAYVALHHVNAFLLMMIGAAASYSDTEDKQQGVVLFFLFWVLTGVYICPPNNFHEGYIVAVCLFDGLIAALLMGIALFSYEKYLPNWLGKVRTVLGKKT